MALPTASDNVFPKVILSEGAAPATPSSGQVKLYAKTDGLLYSKDDAGTETLVSGGAGGGGGDTFVGSPLTVAPLGIATSSGGFGWAANEAHAWPVSVPGTMLVQGAMFDMSVAASGTYEWGLFDYSSNAAACTKLAGGSGALNSTNWVTIAATGAPVTVDPGNYMLIAKAPASNTGEMRYTTLNAGHKACKNQTGYTWDDTPDLTTGWSTLTGVYRVILLGRLASGTQW